MRPYEVMVIFDPGLEEQAIQGHVDTATQLISARGGDPGRVERWGKRRLAYEIQHQRDGYYVLIEAKAEPSTMSELSHSLQLADAVLRHKVIHLPEKIAGKPRPSTPSVEPEAAPVPPAASEAAPETSNSANGA